MNACKHGHWPSQDDPECFQCRDQSYKDEIARLRTQVVAGKTQYGCLKIQEEAALKERDSALLQLGAARDALFAEIRGISCGDDCFGGHYRSCRGCTTRAKIALGIDPEGSIYNYKEKHITNEKSKCYDCTGVGYYFDKPENKCKTCGGVGVI